LLWSKFPEHRKIWCVVGSVLTVLFAYLFVSNRR
jgi:hypothetical protein